MALFYLYDFAVAPLVGAWIEIYGYVSKAIGSGRTPRGCVDSLQKHKWKSPPIRRAFDVTY